MLTDTLESASLSLSGNCRLPFYEVAALLLFFFFFFLFLSVISFQWKPGRAENLRTRKEPGLLNTNPLDMTANSSAEKRASRSSGRLETLFRSAVSRRAHNRCGRHGAAPPPGRRGKKPLFSYLTGYYFCLIEGGISRSVLIEWRY